MASTAAGSISVADRGVVVAIADRAERAGWRRLAVLHIAPPPRPRPATAARHTGEPLAAAQPGGSAVPGPGAGGAADNGTGPAGAAAPADAVNAPLGVDLPAGGTFDHIVRPDGPSRGVAGRLARALSDLGHTVLVIDAGGDAGNHDAIGAAPPTPYAPGFADWASGRCTFLDAVSAGDGAAIMAPGAADLREGLTVERLPTLLRPALAHFDLVLVDLGANGQAWEPDPLIAATDAAILVVAEPVPAVVLRASLARLARLGVGVVGTVVLRAGVTTADTEDPPRAAALPQPS
jgi:hypothetical protein